MMKRLQLGLLSVFGLMIATTSCSRTEPIDGLRDAPDLLSEAAELRIETFQASLLADYNIELVVDMPDVSPGDLSDYAHTLMERLKVGSLTSAGKGILLVVDSASARVRFEVGPDLEHVFPDAFVSRVENDQMAPFFRDGRVGDGIEATVELLVGQAKSFAARGDYTPNDGSRRGDYSAGAGATAGAPIGTTRAGAAEISGPLHGPTATPGAALASYTAILAGRDTRSDLGIYTAETRKMLADRLVTPAQQDNEYRTLAARLPTARYVTADSCAVAFFGADDVPPYFFRRGPGGWMVDLATPARSIRFDHNSRWFLVERPDAYAFAFE